MNVVSLVGRPNTGKSALFNRIAKKRVAIVFDQPGVSTTFVKIVSFLQESSAFGLESIEVPGATPKTPFSGLMA